MLEQRLLFCRCIRVVARAWRKTKQFPQREALPPTLPGLRVSTERRHVMNSSLWSAGRKTHLKIVAVALMASIVVVVVGINSRVESGAPLVLVKAGQPTIYTGNSGPTIR